jgi:tRNA(Ile)-lysidine synthase
MMDLPGRVHAFAQQHQLWTAETPVIAAVSGGGDSVALLLIVHALAGRGHLRLAGVAHLNHQLRGAEAELDAEFVRQLAERLETPFLLDQEDVQTRARRHRQSVEVAGRHARLEFFERLAAAVPSSRIALAHTRSDQAETVLLRLARGAGPRGLAGMAPRTAHRIRPLLDESRDTLRGWLRRHSQTWREDETNADTTIARNLVRVEILPRLARLNSGAEAALSRAARIQGADARFLDELAAREAARLFQSGARAGDVRFSIRALGQLHEALARRVVRLALLRALPGRMPAWDDTEAVLRFQGRRLQIGSITLELFGDSAVLSSREHVAEGREPTEASAVTLALDVPGSATHPDGWWTVDASGPLPQPVVPFLQSTGIPQTAETTRAVVDATSVGRHLTVRGWQPGDRMQPLGLGGRKKLQDVFVDRKVPRDARQQVPIVMDARGQIVWVAGHVLGEPFRVTPGSDAVVVLTLRR